MRWFFSANRKYIRAKNITQKELAKKTGVSASYLSQIFHSERLINFKTLAKIEIALSINFDIKLKTNKSLNELKNYDFNKYKTKSKLRNIINLDMYTKSKLRNIINLDMYAA